MGNSRAIAAGIPVLQGGEDVKPADVVRRLAHGAHDADPIVFRNELAARFEVPQRDMALRMERLGIQTEITA